MEINVYMNLEKKGVGSGRLTVGKEKRISERSAI